MGLRIQVGMNWVSGAWPNLRQTGDLTNARDSVDDVDDFVQLDGDVIGTTLDDGLVDGSILYPKMTELRRQLSNRNPEPGCQDAQLITS